MPPLNIEQKEIVDDVYNLVNVGRLRNESHDPAIARVQQCFRHLNNIDMAFTSTSNPWLPTVAHKTGSMFCCFTFLSILQDKKLT